MSDGRYIKIRRYKGNELVSERRTDFFPPQPTWPLVMTQPHARYNRARRAGAKLLRGCVLIAFGTITLLVYLYVSAWLGAAVELAQEALRAVGAWAFGFFGR